MANFLDKYFGRLGNRMFQMAALYSFAKDFGVDHYFQDPIYFEKYAPEIKQLFSEGIDYDDRVSIHIRCSTNPANPDEPKYSENPFYVSLTKTDYYKKAIELFPNERFLVFSDDIEFAKSIFGEDGFDYSIGKTEEQDLKLMASCKHNIIANSSFSWWAAYLNPYLNKKVIYPKNWYSDGVERTKCPKEWICL